jgi:hypothetical protein
MNNRGRKVNFSPGRAPTDGKTEEQEEKTLKNGRCAAKGAPALLFDNIQGGDYITNGFLETKNPGGRIWGRR